MKSGVIETSKLEVFDELSRTAYGDELRILNSTRLTLDDQRSLFGAVRNMHITAKAMKVKLANASQKHENPTTAGRALTVCETMFNLSHYVDVYMKSGEVPERRTLKDLSLMLYKKAKQAEFSEDAATQFKELQITPAEISNFTKKLGESIETQIDADSEEEPSGNESGSLNESSS